MSEASVEKTAKKHKVLIVGGGFAGVKTALELRGHEEFDVTLLSNSVDFSYYPTFYHTVTGGLHEQSFIPLRELFGGKGGGQTPDKDKSEPHKHMRDKNVRFVLGTAKTLDKEKRLIKTGDGRKFHYDTLILALGSVTNYFGIPGLEQHAYGMKSMDEIARLKRHLHSQLTDDRNPELNYVIVGGGATGVELAGALPEYLRTIRKHHKLPRRRLHIDLVEAAPRLLPRCSKAMSRTVRRRLRKLGVKVYLKTAVQALDADTLTINNKPLRSHTVIWTAGVANNSFFRENEFVLDERGKVVVDEFLRAEPHIFVLGDNAATPYSGMAQTALFDAESVSANLKRLFRGTHTYQAIRLEDISKHVTSKGKESDLTPYKPARPVTVIPVGPDWAAVEWGRLRFSGRIGWLLRSAADWIGFNDIEPWWKATEQWFTDFGTQEECPTCNVARMHQPEIMVKR